MIKIKILNKNAKVIFRHEASSITYPKENIIEFIDIKTKKKYRYIINTLDLIIEEDMSIS